MVSVDKQALISQLCTASKLQGKELEEYRTRLNKMSETELASLISGDKQGDNVDTVELNHSQSTNKTEITKKEAEDSSIQNIESNANQALQMIDSQDDGNISETYNKLKEKFNSDLAKSNVEKVAYKQLETAYFLKEAQANNLTYKEYYEQRKELLYKTFPGVERFNDKQKAGLKRMIDTLSPEQVQREQNRILSLPEKGTQEYDSKTKDFVRDFGRLTTTDVTNTYTTGDMPTRTERKTIPNPKFELTDGERLMSFDEVYSLEQGVNFNKDNIQKYNDSASHFAFLNSVGQKRELIHNMLGSALQKRNTQISTGANSSNMLDEILNVQIKNSLGLLYGKNSIDEGLQQLTNGDTSLTKPQIAQLIINMVDQNYETMLGGKKLEDYANEMAADYKSAYGEKDAANLAQSYVQDQEGVVQNIRAGVEFVGMGVMVGGMILFPPAALAGGALAGFGGAGVELYNETTRDSVNQERTGELKRELVTNALLMGVGMGAGKAGSTVKAALTAKNAPKLAAVAADIGTDSTISLLGDLALTGQVSLEGEGFSQFMALVAGHRGKIVQGIKHVKENIKAKFGPDARQMPDGTVIKVNKDGSTTVLQEGVNDGVETHPATTVAPKAGVNDGIEVSRTTTDTPKAGVNAEVETPNTTADTPTFKTPEELKTFLKNQTVKDESGNDVKKNTKISLLLLVTQHAKTQEGRDAIVYLTGFKDGDKLRFSYNEIKVLVDSVQTQEGREAIEYLANIKDGDNPRFNGFEIRDLIKYAQTQENRDAIQFLANIKVGDKPRFRGYEIKELVELAKTQESRDAIKFLANIKDGDNPRFYVDDIRRLAEPAKTPEGRKFIKKLIDEKEDNILKIINEQNIKLAEQMCNRPDFPKDKIAEIVRATNEQNIKLVEQLCNNPDFPKDKIAGIVEATNEQNIKLAEQLCNDKDLLKEKIATILSYTRGNEEKFGDLYKNDAEFRNYIVQKEEIDSNLRLVVPFWSMRNKTHISELSKVDKKEVLLGLLANKNNLANNNLNDILPLLPQNDMEYTNLIKSITQSLNMSFKPLDNIQQKEFDTGLKNLERSLKTMDLSNLSEINLTMPHTEFISKVQDIIKDLPQEEQAKIQDYFGFKIENDKLTGYPNSEGKDLSLSGIADEKSIAALHQVKTVVDNYTDNNFVTVKDNPVLNQQLKDISKYMPEIFNQIDGSGLPVSTIKSLQKVVQNPKFETLSESDKKVMILSTLLHNTDKTSGSTSESAFDAYFISQRFGVSDKEAQKIYKIVESSDLINKFMATSKRAENKNERKNVFDLLAFNLKESNNFEMAQMLYSSKEQDGLTRYLDKALQNRIREIKSTDFMLPQTPAKRYHELAQEQTIKEHNVSVVKASNIPDFNAYVHTPDVGAATGGSRMANFANFEIFKGFADDKVICVSYLGKDRYCAFGLNGFIFDVANSNQYVGYGQDIGSRGKNISDILVDYYRNRGYALFEHRIMISRNIKEIMGISDDEYIKRLDSLKEKLGSETLSMDRLMELDPEMGNAYKEFLSRNASNFNDAHSLLSPNRCNEVLVSNPKITAIYTKDLDNIPEEYLIKAENEGLPIVVLE